MPKKEYYRHNLPHFQQPGQAYFMTWCLNNTVPKKALERYTQKLKILKSRLRAAGAADSGAADSDPLFKCADRTPHHFKKNANRNPHHLHDPYQKLRAEYYATRRKYIKAFNDLLDTDKNPKINLAKPANLKVITETLQYWEGKKLTNHAFCVMPNHVHWVLELYEKDEKQQFIYLEEIMYSVKRFSATQINKIENQRGKLWQKESFDTTIRDEKHLYNAIEYTLNNPVAAGLVKNREDWPGSFWCNGL